MSVTVGQLVVLADECSCSGVNIFVMLWQMYAIRAASLSAGKLCHIGMAMTDVSPLMAF